MRDMAQVRGARPADNNLLGWSMKENKKEKPFKRLLSFLFSSQMIICNGAGLIVRNSRAVY